MKCPVRPETLFAVLVSVGALLLSGGTAQAATTASGSTVSADGSAVRDQSEDTDNKDDKSASPASLRKQLKKLSGEYEKSQERLSGLTRKQVMLGRQEHATVKRYTASRDRVAQTARTAYIGGPSNEPLVAMATNDDPSTVAQRMTSLSLLSQGDNNAIRSAGKERKRVAAQQGKLTKAKKSASAEQKKISGQRKKINAKLDEAAKKLAKRKNDKGKASRAPKMSGKGACPVGDPVQISDTWGASRGGGSRGHEGTDMLAPMGTPTYAVEGGTISRAGSNGLGGTIVILKGKSGQSFYYAHHSANLVHTGEKVVAGQQVGKVGMSGNAQGTVSHLHFERWPDGSNPVNPYSFVTARCKK